MPGPVLSAQTLSSRLAEVLGRATPSSSVECTVSWHGPARLQCAERGSEATVQARSGLMEVHGWDAGRPRRLGLEVASAGAGVLATCGVLAALVGAYRDRPVARVQTSALQAGLWVVAHHLAAATASGDPLPSPLGPEPGPPFRSSDGHWFEIEVFDADSWKSFWLQMGAGGRDLGRAWTSFRARYYRGRCSLPPGLHQATRRHTLAEAAETARSSRVSLCTVRSYREVLQDPGWSGRHLTVGDPRPEASAAVDGRAAAAGHETTLPLAGVRVVEATSRMQGPLAGLLLQMLGADVVRVEPPGGDVGRMVPPLCGDVGSFFECFNRGKRSVELDLSRPDGRSDLRGLLGGADVFLHNWRPGKAEEWDLDRASVAAGNGHIVYAEAAGWDWGTHNSDVIGTDFLVQAYAGFGDGLNPVGEDPLTSRVLLADCMGAFVTCEGVLAALYLREASDRQVGVATSLLEGAMAAQAHVLAALSAGRDDGRRRGRPLWGVLDRPVATGDGDIVVSVETEWHLSRLQELCGLSCNSGGPEEIEAMVARSIGEGSAEQWEKLLTEAGVPCAVVARDLAALSADPQLAPLFETLSGTCRAPATPWDLEP